MTEVYDYLNNNLTQQVAEINRLKDKLYKKQVNYYQQLYEKKNVKKFEIKNQIGEISLLEEILDFRVEEYSLSQKMYWSKKNNN
jgi:hypothetical protein